VTFPLTYLFRSQTQKINLNFVNSVTSFIGALTGSALVDYVGRRRLLLMSTGTLVLLLTIASSLLSDVTSHARGAAGISMIYLFMGEYLLTRWLNISVSWSRDTFAVVYSFGWTPMQALYPAEVLPYQTRAKGLALYGVVTQASSCINTFGSNIPLF
jgi:MFS family permease